MVVDDATPTPVGARAAEGASTALSADEIEQAARQLRDAFAGRAPVGPLTLQHPNMTVADAYAIQHTNLQYRQAAGHHVVGHKIGLTSEPMQTLLGVDQPDFGYILDDMVLANESTVSTAHFCAPRVEPEVAFLLHSPLGPVDGRPVTVADVYAATEAVAVALEIIDSRIADWVLTLPDTVADNASSGAVVLGEWLPLSAATNLAAAEAHLSVNGAHVDSGLGSAVLGDPAAAVAWLANALAAFGVKILPGQFIMSGSFTAATSVRAGDRATAAIGDLGTVAITLSSGDA